MVLLPIHRKNVLGVQWLVQGKEAELVAPGGRVGTRTDLERGISLNEKLAGRTDFQWVEENRPTFRIARSECANLPRSPRRPVAGAVAI
jgi:hypothetical protein